MRSMITAANTMSQLQQQIDIISNNMANLDTNGYKRKVGTFNELLVQQFNNQPNDSAEVGRNTPLRGIRYGVGSKVGDIVTQFTQGPIKKTEREMDFAFQQPNHFLSVTITKNGQQVQGYTRDGALQLSPVQGNPNLVQVTTGEGYPVNDVQGNPIIVAANGGKVSITNDGSIAVYGAGGNVVQKVALGIVEIRKPQILQSAGSNLFEVSPGNGANIGQDIRPLTNVQVQTSALEGSNVNMQDEITSLIGTQRQFQSVSRTLTMGDQMFGLINNLR